MNLIIYVSNVYYDDVWFSKQHIASRLAKKSKVIYVNPPINLFSFFKDARRLKYLFNPLILKADNLLVVTPISFLPFYRLRKYKAEAYCIYRAVKKVISRVSTRTSSRASPRASRAQFAKIVLWINSPRFVKLISKFNENLSVYHASDDYSKLPSKMKQATKKAEYETLKRIDLVFAVSKKLVQKYKNFSEKVQLMPNGVDLTHYTKFKKVPELEKIKKPIIGYIGSINFRLDIDLIEEISRNFKNASLVFIGSKRDFMANKDWKRLKRLSNVVFLGQKQVSILPSYIKYFDAGIVPYQVNRFNKASNPLKALEYIAAGVPVVSTNISSLENYKGVFITKTSKDFVNRLRYLLQGKEFIKDFDKQSLIDFARKNSWDERVSEIQTIMHV